MKILKILGAAVVLLIAAFLIMGIAVPTYEYGSSIIVHRPQQHCWENFHDTSNMKSWNAGFVSLKLKKGEYKKVGSIYELVMEDKNERMVMTETIMQIDSPREISYLLTNDVLESQFSYTFEAQGDSTKIESHYKVTGNNILWRSILYLSKSYLKDTSEAQLRAFKKHIEQ